MAITERAVLDLHDTLFESNRVLVAEHYDTSAYVETGVAGGGAIFARDGCSIRVAGHSQFIDNTVPANIADEGTGGGVSMWGGSTLRVQGPVVFARNAAHYGGAVFSSDRDGYLVSDRSRQGRRLERCFCMTVAHAFVQYQ